MKRILITGENSYIGTSFADYMKQFKEDYRVETMSVRGDEWKKTDFSIYDVVYHVAGIAHRKETKKNRQLYFDVNFELTKLVAEKAKHDGVKQFIFLSSMSVYGINKGKITKKTLPTPKNAYGASKLKAESLLLKIKDDSFYVSIVRPPMVYGKNCNGNYEKISKLTKKIKIFPSIENRRSMIYIDNLSFIIMDVIDTQKNGIICPQNNELVCTSDLVNEIKKNQGKKIVMSKIFGFIIRNVNFVPILNKIFGDLYYDFYDFKKVPVDFKKSIKYSEEIK